jgi:hypothetical protein
MKAVADHRTEIMTQEGNVRIGRFGKYRRIILICVTVLFSVSLIGFGIAFSVYRAHVSEQRELIEHFKKSLENSLTSVQIQSWNFKTGAKNCAEIESSDDLAMLSEHLNRVDSQRISAPVSGGLEFVLILHFANGTEAKYRTTIYDKQPNALFLSRALWNREPDGGFARKGDQPIRVPGVAEFIRKIYEDNGCA